MEEFIEASDGLSPFFDLDTYVDAERKRNPNLFEDTRCQRLAELESVLPTWQIHDLQYYLISGRWLRQWVNYIFVCLGHRNDG